VTPHQPSDTADSERGSLALETVVVVPLLVLLLLFAIGCARLVHARNLIDQAADQAARAASLGPATDAQARAQNAARTVLAGAYNCTAPRITLSQDQSAAAVTATVSCTVVLNDLFITGFPGHQTLTARQTSPRDLYAPRN
jgi:Flp pilus assembly protein TadG